MGRKDISVFIKARTTRRNHSIPRWMKINYETVSQTDVFLCLPLEIRTLIAGYLCTPDFLRLRLSSRAMALLFESQQFWRTRFLVHGERGYLHFLTDRQESYQGWRLLYRGTNSTHAWPLKFNDWKKQWLINQTIHDRYLMNVLEEEGLSPSLTNNKAESNRPQWPWVQIHWKRYLTQCQMYQRNFPYCNTLLPMPSPGLFGAQRLGCCKSCGSFGHPPTNRKIMVAHPIIKIRFSVLVENERIFLTGFDLIHGSDIPDTSFGYKVPGREILSDLHGQPLRGFRIKTKVPSVAISDICPIIETSEGEDADHGWIGDHGSLVAYREKAGSITGSIRVPSGKENIVGISGYFQVSQYLMACYLNVKLFVNLLELTLIYRVDYWWDLHLVVSLIQVPCVGSCSSGNPSYDF